MSDPCVAEFERRCARATTLDDDLGKPLSDQRFARLSASDKSRILALLGQTLDRIVRTELGRARTIQEVLKLKKLTLSALFPRTPWLDAQIQRRLDGILRHQLAGAKTLGEAIAGLKLSMSALFSADVRDFARGRVDEIMLGRLSEAKTLDEAIQLRDLARSAYFSDAVRDSARRCLWSHLERLVRGAGIQNELRAAEALARRLQPEDREFLLRLVQLRRKEFCQ